MEHGLTVTGIQAATRPGPPVQKGNSRYGLVPADWPQDAIVQVVLIGRRPPEAP